MTLDELLFVKKMLDSGTEISNATWAKVLNGAIAAKQANVVLAQALVAPTVKSKKRGRKR